MDDIINSMLKRLSARGKSNEVLIRYMRMRYKIIIDPFSLAKRKQSLELHFTH